MKITPNKMSISKKGLERFLGSLEASVMEALWDKNGGTVQEIREELAKDYSFNTIMTVMNRLIKKGYLRKDKKTKPYVYSSTIQRETLLSKVMKEFLTSLKSDMRPYILANFVEAMDIDETDIKLLEEYLKK